MADEAKRATVRTRRELRLAERRRALRRQTAAVLAVAVLVLLAIGAAVLTRRAADPTQNVVAVPEPTAAPTTPLVPTPTSTPSPTTTSAPSPTTTPTPTSVPAQTAAPSPAPSAVDCYAVRDAGGGPIRRGERGYAAHLDSDGDGLACEYLRRR